MWERRRRDRPSGTRPKAQGVRDKDCGLRVGGPRGPTGRRKGEAIVNRDSSLRGRKAEEGKEDLGILGCEFIDAIDSIELLMLIGLVALASNEEGKQSRLGTRESRA